MVHIVPPRPIKQLEKFPIMSPTNTHVLFSLLMNLSGLISVDSHYISPWLTVTCLQNLPLRITGSGVSVNATNTKQMCIYHQLPHSINKVDSSLYLESALSCPYLLPSLLQMIMFHLFADTSQLNARFTNQLPVARRLPSELLIPWCRWVVAVYIYVSLHSFDGWRCSRHDWLPAWRVNVWSV